MVYVRDA